MGFNIYTAMFNQLDAALAGVVAAYAGVIGWISGPLRVGVTIYIILLGFAVLRGAVEYPFREFVYRGMKLAALVFAVTTLYGASVGLLAMNGLPREVANAVGAQDVNGLGGFFDAILKGAVRAIANIKEIVQTHTTEEGTNLAGIPNNWDEIIVSEIINVVIMLAALLASALGFAICAPRSLSMNIWRSPYFFSFHKRDIGHTLIVGPTGGGKTVIVNFLMAQAEKTGARQIFIDKDRGAQIFVLASGGTYLTLENGKPTGFAPLKALENKPEDRAWLSLWVRQLVRAESRPITVQEERLIDEGIAAVMRLPRVDRSLDALRTMLGMSDAGGIGARLEKWTSRGSMGWVFDNAVDEMTLDARFIGFDMTDFLDNADIRTPLMLYLFHRVDKLLTGERTIIAVDEFWKALGDDAFRSFAQDGLKTYRKRNAMMVFATQSPADALKSDIAHSILEQVATQVMLPNPKGARRDYVEGFSLTDAEYQLIREELSPESRKFLVKQGHDSVVVELDLTGLDDELAVLSGRAETTPIAVQAAAEFGPDPANWLPVFHQRRRPS